MRAGVVEILALYIKLNSGAYLIGKPFQMRDRRRPALKFLANAAKLADKFTGLADGAICVAYFVHRCLQFRRDKRAAVFAEIAVCIGIVFKVGIKIYIAKFHGVYLQLVKSMLVLVFYSLLS